MNDDYMVYAILFGKRIKCLKSDIKKFEELDPFFHEFIFF